MYSARTLRIVALSIVGLTVAVPAAAAEEIYPGIYIQVDTSGSMLQNPDGDLCYGDGSAEHPHYTTNCPTGSESRLYMAKEAIAQVVAGYPEVRWGLSRFNMTTGWNQDCRQNTVDPEPTGFDFTCGSGSDWLGNEYSQTSWTQGDGCAEINAAANGLAYDLPGVGDRVCINYAGTCTGADILVALADDNEDRILKWVDHQEHTSAAAANQFYDGINPTTGDFCWSTTGSVHGNCELRGRGPTPLGASLQDIFDQLSNTAGDLANDNRKGCRPYVVILLTDGEETCSGDPEGAAAQLTETPDMSSTCTDDTDCPTNSWCQDVGGTDRCHYQVKTYVIGFAVGSSAIRSLNRIAHSGDTGSSISVDNQQDLVIAMAGIIAESVITEYCNHIDDNCNGLVDEGYGVNDVCNNGLVGACNADGVYVCDDTDPTSVVCEVPPGTPSPGELTETCNGEDDDCNGLVDDQDGVEGKVCCTGPELCNGRDDYCDNWASHDEGSEDSRIWDAGTRKACGSDVGECEPGQLFCVAPDVVCQNDTPGTPEECDTLDHDCNGVPNNVDPVVDGCTNDHATYGSCPGTAVCEILSEAPLTVGIVCYGQTPGPEVCNGLDENCDGFSDNVNPDQEFPKLTRDCFETNTHGTCYGVEICNQPAAPFWSTCTAVVPAAESCNQLDDNCNGQVDEGVSQPCYDAGDGGCTGPVGGPYVCMGVCAAGVETCATDGSGTFGACIGATVAEAEECDGKDNDCDCDDDSNGDGTWCGPGDNNVDEDAAGAPLEQNCYTGPSGTEGTGLCHGGTQICTDGGYGACVGQQVPVGEVCDGADNDCDGPVDEDSSGAPLEEPCYDSNAFGTCWGVRQCTESVAPYWGTCDAAEPKEEICNGADDDCDTVVDDNVAPRTCYTGPNGTEGVGICQGGLESCLPGGSPPNGNWSGNCVGEVLPRVGGEICDGLDNDCDNTADEGLTQQCYSYASGCTPNGSGGYNCQGTCSQGTQNCQVNGPAGGNWLACSGDVGPVTEVCDGADNDCDGPADEDPNNPGVAMSEACFKTVAGVGTCWGQRTCDRGVAPWWSDCDAQDPVAETCNGADDNCDGQVDEGLGTTTCGQGECQHTINNCDNGTPQTCDPNEGSTAEICDGKDNDCDGLVDEDPTNPALNLTAPCYTGPNGTLNVGNCAEGYRTCTNGGWGPCEHQVTPQPEICDGDDNDCDTHTDEDANNQPLTETCQNEKVGVGTCLGTRTCTAGSPLWWTDCDAAEPFEEVCDGRDNDCDGKIDGITRPCFDSLETGCTANTSGGFTCLGVCWPGAEVCPELQTPDPDNNSFGSCAHAVYPSQEICDDLDNDCDGDVDEGADGNPLARTCYWPGYGPNTGCESAGNCVGACQEGQQICGNSVPGEWDVCQGEVTPIGEVCDATDNDCDGEVDEVEDMPWIGQACPASLGVCNGIWACTNGVRECIGSAAQPGRCNGLDDDCDGVTDELDELQQDPQYGQSCGTDDGECVAGTLQCVGGGWVCENSVGPSEEVCDGLDNNCDSLVDNQAECPPQGSLDYYCIEGACRVECDATAEFPCPAGLECVQRDVDADSVTVCLPPVGECGGTTCPEGWVCQNDVCVDACDPNPCGWWENCHEGQCTDPTCSGPGGSCPAGQFCVDHACSADPCATAGCDLSSSYCLRDCDAQGCTARCEPLCDCPGGQLCDAAGACTEDPCASVECGLGERCAADTGQCEPDPCNAVFCDWREVCFEGDCIDDPCLNLVCPAFFDCVVRPEDNGTGDASPTATCEPDPSYWIPGTDGNEFLATGGGGCQCRSADHDSGTGAVLFGVLLLGWLGWRRRRRSPEPRRLRGTAGPLLGLLLGLTAVSGCKLDPYDLSDPGRWDRPDAGDMDSTVTTQDASPDACVPVDELCDEQDNDCDGLIDEDRNGDPITNSDPNNCGTCGNACEFDNALSECQSGSCVMLGCFPGFHDVDQSSTNGCEYECHETNDGTETCDGKDNDCNGAIDEIFDLDTDPLNCGDCANVCVFLNGFGACQLGQCELDSCRGGYVNRDNDVDNGCECKMGAVEGGTPCIEGVSGQCAAGEVCGDLDDDGFPHCATIPLDLCDGRDNDCDSLVDEDATALLQGSECFTHSGGCSETSPGEYDCQGECQPGAWTCRDGLLICSGQQGPVAETCNNLDDDCNGTPDDGWNKQTDPNNCGTCGNACAPQLPNAIPECFQGQCRIAACLPGYHDNSASVPGCEYYCVPTSGGIEQCGDGRDNDCDCPGDTNGDGQLCTCNPAASPRCDDGVDEGFDLVNDPNHCGGCNHNCELEKPYGTRVMSTPCQSGQCQYECDTNYHDLVNGILTDGCEYYCVSSGAEQCDGDDNDCDNQIDEDFKPFATNASHCGGCGRNCTTLAPPHMVVAAAGCVGGACQYDCDTNWVDTDPTSPGCECQIQNGGVELCNTVDDDCDGVVDNIQAGQGTLYYRDLDNDGHGDPNDSKRLCAADTVARYTATVAGDCNDANPTVNPDQPEICDNLDNDCDPATDENAMTRDCYTGPNGTKDVGTCVGGQQTCTNGNWSAACAGEVTPQAEQCDNQDRNCNHVLGSVEWDTSDDPQNCGACNTVCDTVVAHATSTCDTGNCIVVTCDPNWWDINGVATDGCEYPCTKTSENPVCDGAGDANCNNQTDSAEFEPLKDTDPLNCGSCGNVCAASTPENMEADTPACDGGSCQYVCQTGYHDVNADLTDGCECNKTANDDFTCDGIDDDCDCPGDTNGDGVYCGYGPGGWDDGVDEDVVPLTQTDEDNCGACGNRCSDLGNPATYHAQTAVCTAGVCTFTCLAGWNDLNGDLNSGRPFGPNNNGCEYPCTPDSPPTEVCDGADNDCNGSIDIGGDGQLLWIDCYTAGYPDGCTAPGSCTGPCQTGKQFCDGTGYSGACQGEVPPVPEICGDGVDNDCNGATDDYDLTLITDCGSCGNNCLLNAPDNTLASCTDTGGGNYQCTYACISGYHDNENGMTDGCEYLCAVNPPEPGEKCNGLDDDCDGTVDETDGMELAPTCFQGFTSGTPCEGIDAICDAALDTWRCPYPATVEMEPGSHIVVSAVEGRCDDEDGNCDGFVDESFNVDDTCDNGEKGNCRGTGTIECTSLTVSECVLNDGPAQANPMNEICDGEDNDCDGLVDELQWENVGANDPTPYPAQRWMVLDTVDVALSGGGTSKVFTYEASRPSSRSGDAGTGVDLKACSKDGVLPWAFVTYQQAARACWRVGMRLCQPEEWEEACTRDVATRPYPYGPTYNGTTCNGADNGPGAAVNTGSETGCYDSQRDAYDMSGNLREWTDDFVGLLEDGRSIYRLRGGGYVDLEGPLECGYENTTYVEDVVAPYVGFRCCTSCGDGVVQPWESCDGAAGCDPVLCVPSSCGNGTVDSGEDCDDGGNLPFDGCSPDCLDEPVCGDGVPEGNEECDDGNGNNDDGCSDACTIVPFCGDGELWGLEECDDGNGGNGDGCSSTCTLEYNTIDSNNFSTCPGAWSRPWGGSTWVCCPGGTDCGLTTAPGTGGYTAAISQGNGSIADGIASPSLDLSTYTFVRLRFNHQYVDLDASDEAYILFWDGSGWWIFSAFTATSSGPVEIDMTGYVAGLADVRIGFYYSGNNDRYWAVDDVVIEGSTYAGP